MKKKSAVAARRIRKSTKRKIILTSIVGVLALASTGLYLFYVQPEGLTVWELYQNAANPAMRSVRIDAGMRKEEVVDRFAKTLGWTEAQKDEFVRIHTKANNNNSEGYYFPGTYVLSANAKPVDASMKIQYRFNERIVSKQARYNSGIINLDTAIKIASIIQREAGGKHDMKIISGVIWNRMYQGMTLDMDATLQYPKGTTEKWWPRVVPADTKTDSPYNTYKNKGLPPTAISNPSEDAIWAAMNPTKTTTIFYIHDEEGRIHTARTYTEHLSNIERYY